MLPTVKLLYIFIASLISRKVSSSDEFNFYLTDPFMPSEFIQWSTQEIVFKKTDCGTAKRTLPHDFTIGGYQNVGKAFVGPEKADFLKRVSGYLVSNHLNDWVWDAPIGESISCDRHCSDHKSESTLILSAAYYAATFRVHNGSFPYGRIGETIFSVWVPRTQGTGSAVVTVKCVANNSESALKPLEFGERDPKLIRGNFELFLMGRSLLDQEAHLNNLRQEDRFYKRNSIKKYGKNLSWRPGDDLPQIIMYEYTISCLDYGPDLEFGGISLPETKIRKTFEKILVDSIDNLPCIHFEALFYDTEPVMMEKIKTVWDTEPIPGSLGDDRNGFDYFMYGLYRAIGGMSKF